MVSSALISDILFIDISFLRLWHFPQMYSAKAPTSLCKNHFQTKIFSYFKINDFFSINPICYGHLYALTYCAGFDKIHISTCFYNAYGSKTLSVTSASEAIRKIVSEYDQEIPQSQTADNPMTPRGRASQPSQDTRKTNQAKQPAFSVNPKLSHGGSSHR